MGTSQVIDYKIHGSNIQYVEIILDPGETVVAENGSMMFMESGIQMDTKIGDGSADNSGFFGSILGLGKRKVFLKETAFLSFFTNKAQQRKSVAFSAPYPGEIVPLNLANLGGAVYCQKKGFLCGAKGVAINVGFTKKLGAGFFGGEGFILQKIEGDGLAFIHSGGTIAEKELGSGEVLYVDTGSIVAFQATAQFDIKMVRGFKNIMFGSENLFLSTLVGPGKVWVQSMPYPRFVTSVLQTWIEMNKKKK